MPAAEDARTRRAPCSSSRTTRSTASSRATCCASRGYRVLEADTGEEGIEIARRERPHLILMDLQLPGLDGIEATRRLKADPRTREIPVVALSAHAQEADEAARSRSGMRRLHREADPALAFSATGQLVSRLLGGSRMSAITAHARRPGRRRRSPEPQAPRGVPRRRRLRRPPGARRALRARPGGRARLRTSCCSTS